MVNIKNRIDILEGKEYKKLIDIIKKYDQYVSESDILTDYLRFKESDSLEYGQKKCSLECERKKGNQKLKRLFNENILQNLNRNDRKMKVFAVEKPIIDGEEYNRKKLRSYLFYKYTKKKQSYYYYPQNTNYMVIGLMKIYNEIEKHNFVSEDDLKEINTKIITFSLHMSLIEVLSKFTEFNIENENMRVKRPEFLVDIKFKANNQEILNILKKTFDKDVFKLMYNNPKGSKENKEEIKFAIQQVKDIFQILSKYYNTQYLATKHFD